MAADVPGAMDPITKDDSVGLAPAENRQARVQARLSSRRDDMDVLQINYADFALQAVGLAAWVFIAAAVYAIVEKFVDARHQ
jgi:hypothetical protein